MKRIVAVLVFIVCVFTLSACGDVAVRGSICKASTDGNAELDIMPQKLLEKINVGDTVVVTVGGADRTMPFVDEIVAEDGKMQLFFDEENWNIQICVITKVFAKRMM